MRTIVTHVVYAASVSDVNDTNPPWAYEILVGNDRVRIAFCKEEREALLFLSFFFARPLLLERLIGEDHGPCPGRF